MKSRPRAVLAGPSTLAPTAARPGGGEVRHNGEGGGCPKPQPGGGVNNAPLKATVWSESLEIRHASLPFPRKCHLGVLPFPLSYPPAARCSRAGHGLSFPQLHGPTRGSKESGEGQPEKNDLSSRNSLALRAEPAGNDSFSTGAEAGGDRGAAVQVADGRATVQGADGDTAAAPPGRGICQSPPP